MKRKITIISENEAYMEGFEGFNIMKITDMRVMLQTRWAWDIESIVYEAFEADMKRKKEKEKEKRRIENAKRIARYEEKCFFGSTSYTADIMDAYNEYRDSMDY